MKLAVEITGATDGTPFVWGHGLTSSMAAEDDMGVFGWSSLEGVRLVRYDAPSHGRSPLGDTAEAHRWDRLAADMLRVADQAGFDSFVAGGASMGAATALHAAVQEPDRVDGLVLVIPPTAWETRAAQAGVYRMAFQIVEDGGIDALLDLERQMPGQGPLADPAIREAAYRNLQDMAARGLMRAFEGAAQSDLPTREDIAELRQPTLILAWTDDPGHPLSTANELLQLLPHADLHVAESPEAVKADWPAVLQSFFAGLPGV